MSNSRNDFTNLFRIADEFFSLLQAPPRRYDGEPSPAMRPAPVSDYQVVEFDDRFVYRLDVPGFAEQDLSIEVKNRHLVITGEQRESDQEQAVRARKSFTRRFRLPVGVDHQGLSATLSLGVLEVIVPKSQEQAPLPVPITSKD